MRSRKSYSLQAFHQVSRLTKHELLPGTRACARQMSRMEKSIESTKRSFATVRTGRANPSMLDRVEARPSAHRVRPRHTAACACRDATGCAGRLLWSADARAADGQRVCARVQPPCHPAV